jgi:hypothetical protein
MCTWWLSTLVHFLLGLQVAHHFRRSLTLWTKVCRHFKDDAELFQYMGVDKRSKPQDGFEFSYKVNFGAALNAQKVEFRPPALCR